MSNKHSKESIEDSLHLDLETMGVGPSAKIFEIGAISDLSGKEFFVQVDVASYENYGNSFSTDKLTLSWLKAQNLSYLEGKTPILEAMRLFLDWFDEEKNAFESIERPTFSGNLKKAFFLTSRCLEYGLTALLLIV